MSSTTLHTFLSKLSKTNDIKINPRHDFNFDKTGFYNFFPEESNILGYFKELNFSSYFIQNFNIPDYDVTDDNTVETMLSKSTSHRLVLTPSSNTFTMSIINTNRFFIENIFYVWLNELKSPIWNYEDASFTTASFKIQLENSVISYVFHGCRPTEIELYKPTQELVSTMTRDVTFTFDFMEITSKEFNDFSIDQYDLQSSKPRDITADDIEVSYSEPSESNSVITGYEEDELVDAGI